MLFRSGRQGQSRWCIATQRFCAFTPVPSISVDPKSTLVDKDGNIFKEAKDVDAWLKEFDKIANTEDEININTIQDAIGIQITDDNDKPIEFDNSIEGIKSYINAVVETARDEHYELSLIHI